MELDEFIAKTGRYLLRASPSIHRNAFNQFRGEKEPVIAYGATTMNPTCKRELSVPVKYVYEKCKQKYKTVKENEKYSTIMHHKCQGITVAVKKGSEYTRGLR